MNRLSVLAVCFVFVGASLQAQNLPPEVFDPNSCGCNIDVERIKAQDATYIATVNADREAMKATFRTYNNEKALSIIDKFYDSKTAQAQNIAINETMKALSPKKDNWKENLQADFKAIVSATNPAQPALGQYFACQFATRLHRYYLQYPDEAGNAAAFYNTYARNNPAPTPTPNPANPNSSAANVSDTSAADPNAAAAPVDANGDTTPWFWMLVGLGSAIAAAYFFVTRPKDQTMEVHQLQKDLQEAKERELKLREDYAQMKIERDRALQRIKDLEAQLALYERGKPQQHIPVNPIGVKPNDSTQQQPQQFSTAAVRRYLYAPSMDGVFTSNSVKTQPDPDAFYVLEMQDENSSTATLRLILDPAVLRRAEAMAQQYLLTACDLKGVGRLPQNLSASNITPGEARREGQGWRISKKIVLTW